MIEYVEIRSAATRELIGIVDTSDTVIWHSVYYGVGDFEIYVPCTVANLSLLQKGNYVTRPDDRHVGIIEKVQITYDAENGRMLDVIGKFSKALLNRRIIYKLNGTSVSPTIISGNVETAVRSLVNDNAISCPFDSGRNMAELKLGELAGISKVIIDDSAADADKQVTYKGLLDYTDGVLKEYGMSAYCALADDLKLAYTVYEGADRSVDNKAGNEPVIFSQDFDNLLSSDYQQDTAIYKNTALIGGAGEGTDRFCVLVKSGSGIDRREMFVDASSHSKTYEDSTGTQQTLSDAKYAQQLRTIGTQTVAGYPVIETFAGDIDITNGTFKYREHFDLGDIVTVQDTEIDVYINTRAVEVLETQDSSGYRVSAVFES